MKLPPFLFALLGAALPACTVSHGTARTFADVEAIAARTEAEWTRSQLTSHPQQRLLLRDLRFRLFFQLPFEERVVVIIDSFAHTRFDGEVAWFMSMLLTSPTIHDLTTPETAASRAYTKSIFEAIDRFPESRLRAFCRTDAGFALFQQNLKRWRSQCLSPARY